MNEDILESINKAETIIIQRHQRPDPDAVGSQLGLRASLRETYPDKKIYAVGYDEPSLAYIGKMDDVSDECFKGALVIVNDTANTPRIDDARYQWADAVIKIDHHPDDDPYGTYRYVDTSASSASEIWAEFILSPKTLFKMTTEAAKCLFLGIVGDTGRFLFDNTTEKTLFIASQLLAYDFPASELMQQAGTQSLAQAQLQGYALEHIQLSRSKKVGYVTITQDLLKQLDLSESETYNIVQVPGSIEGVEAWVTFIEQANGTYRCRIRSKTFAINEIAKQHHGGGHPKASGANARDTAECEQIVMELEALAIDGKR